MSRICFSVAWNNIFGSIVFIFSFYILLFTLRFFQIAHRWNVLWDNVQLLQDLGLVNRWIFQIESAFVGKVGHSGWVFLLSKLFLRLNISKARKFCHVVFIFLRSHLSETAVLFLSCLDIVSVDRCSITFKHWDICWLFLSFLSCHNQEILIELENVLGLLFYLRCWQRLVQG